MLVNALIVYYPRHQRVSPRNVPLRPGCWFSVGRDRNGDVALDHNLVSRHHARVRVRDRGLVVEDLGSRNGTWLVREDGEEERLEAGCERTLPQDALVRVGPYLIAPCEHVGENVLLRHAPLADSSGADDGSSPTSQGTGEAFPGLIQLSSVLDRPFAEDPWDWTLEGLMILSGGERGLLFSRVGDRFCLKASRGIDSGACVSQRFLEQAAKGNAPLSLVTGRELPEALSSRSLAEYIPEVRLLGVPFSRANGESAAVAYIECASTSRTDLELVSIFRAATVPLLEVGERCDLETRRREALQFRVEPARSVATRAADAEPEDVRIVGSDPSFSSAVELARRAAGTPATILIRGPSGSGKDVLARLVHAASARCAHPFDVVNAAALPEDLVESALFGHERGAFTGADRAAVGAFERADGGTLFLDEIGDLSLAAQAKILRAVESGEIARVGGSSRRVDVRLVAATHRDLEKMVEEGTFREDLFYRLRVVEVTLPALAKRKADIPVLAEHFLGHFRRPDGTRVAGLSPRALRALVGYPWPGNVRELRNVIERAVVLDQDELIDLDDLPTTPGMAAEEASSGADGSGLEALMQNSWSSALDRFERDYFVRALARNGGERQRTASETGVTRRTVSEKIRKHGIREDEIENPG